MKIKSISKKLIICLMVFLVLFDFGVASVSKVNLVYADTEQSDDEIAAEAEEESTNLVGGILSGVAGILTWIPRALINICSMLLQTLAYFVINTAGHGTNEVSVLITPFDIFFNRFTLTDINIFSVDDLPNTSGGDLVYNIREFAAMLYYIVRAICIGILLIMLLIIGIKMALASLAEEKAKVKRMFFDWVVSVGLVILMHMIIIIIITANEFLIEIIEKAAGSAGIEDMVDSLRSAAFSIDFLLGWGSTIAYSILTVQTMFFVIIYIIRLFKVIFLIVLSPIMPLTYSIDKAKSGQANTLNGWVKEFISNVFIQVIHCIIYVVIVAVPMSGLESVSIGSISGLTQPLILCIALMFVKKAEELMKSLFGFDKAITITTFSSVVNSAQRAVLTGVSMANGTYTVTNNMANNKSNVTFGSNIQTLGQRASEKLSGYKDKVADWLSGEDNRLTLSDTDYGDDAESKNRVRDGNNDDLEFGIGDSQEGEDENSQQEGEALIPLMDGASSEETANKVAEAIKSIQEDKYNNEEVEPELNGENLEEFLKDENFFSEVRYDRSKLDDKEKADFIRDLENILEKYRNGQAELEDILKHFEEYGLEYDDKLIQSLFNKFRLKTPEVEDKDSKVAELTEGNLEKFIDKNNIISKWQNESNYRPPEIRKEFIKDLMDGLDKYKNGEIGIDELKKRFSAYGIEIDDSTLNNLIKEFVPEEIEERKEERSKLEIVENEDIETDIVDIGTLRLPKRDLNKIMLDIHSQTIYAAKISEILNADITAEGDLSQEGLVKFNTKILEKANMGAFTQSNFQQAEEAVRREGELSVRRLENFRREQTEANARMLTSAGKELAILEIQAQQAGLFISEARLQTSSTTDSSQQGVLTTSSQTLDIPTTNQSNNVLEVLNNNKKKYA